jgi:transcriptional regulator with XRE-family HTH domain
VTTSPPPGTFGGYVAHMRNLRGYSARELARRAGTAPSNITRIEDGTFDVPGPILLCAVGDALEFDYPTAVGFLEPYRRLWERLAASGQPRTPSENATGRE